MTSVSLFVRLLIPSSLAFITADTLITFNYKGEVITSRIDNQNEKDFGIATRTNASKNNYDLCITERYSFPMYLTSSLDSKSTNADRLRHPLPFFQ